MAAGRRIQEADVVVGQILHSVEPLPRRIHEQNVMEEAPARGPQWLQSSTHLVGVLSLPPLESHGPVPLIIESTSNCQKLNSPICT